MMHFDMPLRKKPAFCIPKGPSFSRAKKISTEFLGTKLEFKAPKHKPTHRLKFKPIFPKRCYRQERLFYKSIFRPKYMVADSWESIHLFMHEWGFNGPWFTGNLANLTMSVNIFQQKADATGALKSNKNNISFFHPRAFEQAVADYLTNEYSLRKTDGCSDYIAPVNWRPVSGLPGPAARFEVRRNEAITFSSYTEYIFFTLSDTQLGLITFRPTQSAKGNQAKKDSEVGRGSMVELMDNIVGSLKIELSPEAKQAQIKAVESLEDTSVTDEFLPIKWTTAADDALWESTQRLHHT